MVFNQALPKSVRAFVVVASVSLSFAGFFAGIPTALAGGGEGGKSIDFTPTILRHELKVIKQMQDEKAKATPCAHPSCGTPTAVSVDET